MQNMADRKKFTAHSGLIRITQSQKRKCLDHRHGHTLWLYKPAWLEQTFRQWHMLYSPELSFYIIVSFQCKVIRHASITVMENNTAAIYCSPIILQTINEALCNTSLTVVFILPRNSANTAMRKIKELVYPHLIICMSAFC